MSSFIWFEKGDALETEGLRAHLALSGRLASKGRATRVIRSGERGGFLMSRLAAREMGKAIGVLGIVSVWISLFIIGLRLNSGDPAKELSDLGAKNAASLKALELTWSVALTWSWSNALLLCLLATVLGALARRKPPYYAEALALGFGVYVFLIAGQLSVGGLDKIRWPDPTNPAAATLERERAHEEDWQGYFRLATLASTLGLIVGWRPEVMSGLFRKAASLIEQERQGGEVAGSLRSGEEETEAGGREAGREKGEGEKEDVPKDAGVRAADRGGAVGDGSGPGDDRVASRKGRV